MPVFAAIDIGANSVRLKIARPLHGRLKVIHEDREVTRLGEAVFTAGSLAPAAINKTVTVLRRFHKEVQARAADKVRVVATSALRDARNAQAFIDWVQAGTGWNVEVISGIEEARLIHLGIVSNLRPRQSPMLLIDLGGGSCELTLSERGHIKETVSVPLGAVRLTQMFLRHDPPTRNELQGARRLISGRIGRITPRVTRAHPKVVIATGGTAAALDSIYRAISGRKASKRDLVPRKAAVKFAEKLSKMSYEERFTVKGLGSKRAEIIVAGAWVYAELLERCDLSGFVYSDLGLRDGMLALMAAEHGTARSRKRIEAERWDALLAAGRHYHVDLAQARQVRKLTMELFEGLRRLHRLPDDYEEWLSAAAMLHEVGSYVNRTGWHRHAYYIIANSELLGYTPQQRRTIAAIARYVGNSLPSPGDKYIKALPAPDRKLVPKAVALLRLARAMNQGRRGAVASVRPQEKDGRVLLRLKASRRLGADLELWMLAKERGYFREVFGRELAATLS